MMFELILFKAIHELVIDPSRFRHTATASEVCNNGIWTEHNLPPRICNPALPVRFLGVHEKAFIEAADLFIDLSAHQHACANHKFDGSFRVMWPLPIIS